MDPRQAIAHNLSRLRGGPPTAELVRRQVLGLVQRRTKLRAEVRGLERRRAHMRRRLELLEREAADWRARGAVARQGGRADLASEADSRAEFCDRERTGLLRAIARCEGTIAATRPKLDAVSEALNGFLRKGPQVAGELPQVPLLPSVSELGRDSLRAELDRIERELAWDEEAREVSRRASESDRMAEG